MHLKDKKIGRYSQTGQGKTNINLKQTVVLGD